MFLPLREILAPNAANIVTESVERRDGGKDMFMRGIFIEGDVRNQNERIYPANEIAKAVQAIQERIESGYSVLGEADHPEDLNINLDRVSHVITEISMAGTRGMGKLKLLPTPMGNLCRTMLENGVKLGVSSRGSGEVDARGYVSGYQIITVDIVANPSAPNAYPEPIYEALMNHRSAKNIWDIASAVNHDKKAEAHIKNEVLPFIRDLGRMSK